MNLNMHEARPRSSRAGLDKNVSNSSLSDLEAAVNGVFVLVVDVSTESEPRLRRRVFLQAQSAQRAADRAVERGHHAEVVLCRLVPVEIPGRWSA